LNRPEKGIGMLQKGSDLSPKNVGGHAISGETPPHFALQKMQFSGMNQMPRLPGKSDRKLCNTTARLSVIAKGDGEQKTAPLLREKYPC
jgi:hypothetical protein